MLQQTFRVQQSMTWRSFSALFAMGLLLSIMSVSHAQEDSPERKGFRGAIDRFLGVNKSDEQVVNEAAESMEAKEAPSPRQAPAAASKAPNRGAFKGGLFHQLKAITGGQDAEAEVGEQEVAPTTPTQRKVVPTQEPFSKPAIPPSQASVDKRTTVATLPKVVRAEEYSKSRESLQSLPSTSSENASTLDEKEQLSAERSSRRAAGTAAIDKPRSQPNPNNDSDVVSLPRYDSADPIESVEEFSDDAPLVQRKRTIVSPTSVSTGSKDQNDTAKVASRSSTVVGGNAKASASPLPDPISLSTNYNSPLKDLTTATQQQVPAANGSGNSALQVPAASPLPTASNAKPNSSPKVSNDNSFVMLGNAQTLGGDDKLLEMMIPEIYLWVDGPKNLRVNEPATFKVSATNKGTTQVVGLLVSALVPTGVTATELKVSAGELEAEDLEDASKSILWQLPELPPGQTRTLTLQMSAQKPEHFGMDLEWTVLPQSEVIDLAALQPQLAIAIEGPSEVLYGQPELYRMRVRNPGNADVKDVEVSLNAETFGTNTSKIGDVPAGQERIVEVELTFQKSGRLSIVAGAKSSTTGLSTESEIDVSVEEIQLQTACMGPERQFQGSIADYEFKVRNSSDVAANNVACEIQLPAGATVAQLPPGTQLEGTKLVWQIESIAALGESTLVVPLQMNELGEQSMHCTAINSFGLNAQSSTVVLIDTISDLKLTVVDPVAPAPVSEHVVYELEVRNRGSKPAYDVSVVAQFSDGIEPVAFEGANGQMVPGQVIFEPIGEIGAGDRAILRITAVAAESGMHRFRAEVQCDNGETHLVQEESTRYLTTALKTDGTIRR